jgi:hypothetical protein
MVRTTLSHIYGLEEEEGVRFLSLELVEGETLQEPCELALMLITPLFQFARCSTPITSRETGVDAQESPFFILQIGVVSRCLVLLLPLHSFKARKTA